MPRLNRPGAILNKRDRIVALTVRSGKIYVYHLFDVADTIDLARVQKLLGHGTTVVKLVARRPTPQAGLLAALFQLVEDVLHARPFENPLGL